MNAVMTTSLSDDDKHGIQRYRTKFVVRDSSISASVSNWVFFITYIQQPRSRGLYRMEEYVSTGSRDIE